MNPSVVLLTTKSRLKHRRRQKHSAPENGPLYTALGTRNGGLGFRKSMKYSHAAYLASATSCSKRCKLVDQQFIWDAENQNSHVARALSTFNANVLEEDKITLDNTNTIISQKVLSEALDKALITVINNDSDVLN